MISDSLDYDCFDDLMKVFSAEDSITKITDLIEATNAYKIQLEQQIRDADTSESMKNDNETEISRFDLLFEEVKTTKELSRTTEATIAKLTHDISHLDNAKRNITSSMTWFENIRILSESYVTCKKCLVAENYVEMSGPYKVMHSLANSFQEYKSLEEFNKFLNSINVLENSTALACENVCREFLKQGLNSKYNAETIKKGICGLAESNTQFKKKILTLCLDTLLYEIKEIFQVDDEAGSLENLPRRYIFFKRVLNNFQSNLSEYFPNEWSIPLKLTERFYSITSSDLKILLNREIGTKGSIDLFMKSLQETLEFEKYISVKFSHKFQGKISTWFEPYLKLWVKHQDSTLRDKMLNYLNETKLPPATDSLVVPSSADLFRTYRSILSQALALMEGAEKSSMMLELALFFAKWLKEYSTKILEPLLLPETEKIENKSDVITYTVLLVNTADYCSVTIDQLEDKLLEYLADGDKCGDEITTALQNVKQNYTRLIASGINLLLYRILDKDFEFVWREFSNMNWSGTVVEDYSRYMTTLRTVLDPGSSERTTLKTIVTQFNRDVYAWNFLDKTIDHLTFGFEAQIIKLLKPSLPYGTLNSKRQFEMKQVISIGEQLLLDLELMKQILQSLPENLSTQDNSGKRIAKHVNRNTERLSHFLKLLVTPLDSDSTYFETYTTILESKEIDPNLWAFILGLKGAPWELALWKRVWSEFEGSGYLANPEKFSNLIFNVKEVSNFITNLSRITDPAWKKFIEQELKITFKSTISQASMSTQSSPSPQPLAHNKASGHKISENLKNLVSNSSFFKK